MASWRTSHPTMQVGRTRKERGRSWTTKWATLETLERCVDNSLTNMHDRRCILHCCCVNSLANTRGQVVDERLWGEEDSKDDDRKETTKGGDGTMQVLMTQVHWSTDASLTTVPLCGVCGCLAGLEQRNMLKLVAHAFRRARRDTPHTCIVTLSPVTRHVPCAGGRCAQHGVPSWRRRGRGRHGQG